MKERQRETEREPSLRDAESGSVDWVLAYALLSAG